MTDTAESLAALCRGCPHRRDTYARGVFGPADECTHPNAHPDGVPRGYVDLRTWRVTCAYQPPPKTEEPCK